MEQILDIIISTDFFYSILRISTPIIYAALGALITSRAGVVNIGLEGMMLCAALTGVIISAFTQSALLGLAGAVLVSVAVSLMMSYVTLVLKSHITLTGIAINTFGSGATVFVLYLVCNDKGISSSLASKTIPQVNIPLLEHVPVLGEVLSGHNILTYLSLVAVALTWVLLNKTVLGLRIRAVGGKRTCGYVCGGETRALSVYRHDHQRRAGRFRRCIHVHGLCVVVRTRYDCRAGLHCTGSPATWAGHHHGHLWLCSYFRHGGFTCQQPAGAADAAGICAIHSVCSHNSGPCGVQCAAAA